MNERAYLKLCLSSVAMALCFSVVCSSHLRHHDITLLKQSKLSRPARGIKREASVQSELGGGCGEPSGRVWDLVSLCSCFLVTYSLVIRILLESPVTIFASGGRLSWKSRMGFFAVERGLLSICTY